MLLLLVIIVILSLIFVQGQDIKLTYFNGKGNAEVSRMLLHLSNVEFSDIRAGKDFDWKVAKESGLYGANLNRLPVLSVGSIEIGQTKAIEHFIARRYGFMGSDEFEAAKIEAICEHCTDIRSAIKEVKARREKGSAELTEALAHFMSTEEEGGALRWVSRIEKYIDGASGFAVGTKLSLADLYLHQMITYFLEDADQSLMRSRHPKIAAIVTSVDEALMSSAFREKYSQGEF